MPQDRDREEASDEDDRDEEETDREGGDEASEATAKGGASKVDDDAADEDVSDDDDESEDASDSDADEEASGADADADADDDDDEEEVAPPPKKKSKAASGKKRGRERRGEQGARKRPRRESAPLPSEREIDTPSRQTLGMIAIMAFATLGMWGAARFACNAHPAQTRKPRDVTTAELAREPKDAALELQQRWASYDYQGALELAKGPIAKEIQQGLTQCQADQGSCDQKRSATEGKVLATAVLLSRDGSQAKVRVSSQGGATGEKTEIYALEQDGPIWKVVGRTDAPPPPAPKTAEPEPSPAPSGSAPSGAAPGE